MEIKRNKNVKKSHYTTKINFLYGHAMACPYYSSFSKDYEYLAKTIESMIYAAMVIILWLGN
jgi:hypothetical protein